MKAEARARGAVNARRTIKKAKQDAVLQQRILAVLTKDHRGEGAAMVSTDLAAAVGLGGSDATRIVRAAISDMRANRCLVGSSEAGYFMIETASEWQGCRKELRGRALAVLHVVKGMEEGADLKFGPGTPVPFPELEELVKKLRLYEKADA